MSILNYTTKIAAEKTVSQIQKMLAGAGASAILMEYDDDAILTSVSFRLFYRETMVSFRLPAQIDRVLAVLHRDPHVPR